MKDTKARYKRPERQKPAKPHTQIIMLNTMSEDELAWRSLHHRNTEHGSLSAWTRYPKPDPRHIKTIPTTSGYLGIFAPET